MMLPSPHDPSSLNRIAHSNMYHQTILSLYVRAGVLEPWLLPLLVLSKRLHSIYMLRQALMLAIHALFVRLHPLYHPHVYQTSLCEKARTVQLQYCNAITLFQPCAHY